MQDEDAVKAAKDVLRKKELEQEIKTVTNEIEELEKKKEELEKEYGSY